jgi:phosphatidylethanolamine-binding protein (PEBP) family uncharacterized protein
MVDGSYVHWVVTGLPPTATDLAPAPAGKVSTGVVGTSIAGESGYVGPCVAGHEYVYTLHALSKPFVGTSATTLDDVTGEIAGSVLASSSVVTRVPAATTP